MNHAHHVSAESSRSLDEDVYAPPIWHPNGADRATGPRLDPRRFAVALTVVAGVVNLALFLFVDAAQRHANSHISFFGGAAVWIPALWLGGAVAFGAYFLKIRRHYRIVAAVEMATVLYWSYRLLILGCQRCASSG